MATLLLAEHEDSTLNGATAKALTAALALGAPVHVLVVGAGCGPAAGARVDALLGSRRRSGNGASVGAEQERNRSGARPKPRQTENRWTPRTSPATEPPGGSSATRSRSRSVCSSLFGWTTNRTLDGVAEDVAATSLRIERLDDALRGVLVDQASQARRIEHAAAETARLERRLEHIESRLEER